MLAACKGSGPVVDWQPSEAAVWQAGHQDLQIQVRIAVDEGDTPKAKARLARVLSAAPDSLTARFMQQDISLAEAGADVAGLAARARDQAATPGAAPIEALLAARLETDGEAGRLLIEGALVRAKGKGFKAASRYALAHIAFARGDSKSARRELDRSLALDPGGARARRLEARLVAASGDRERTEALLSHWIDSTEWAPEIAGNEWYDALVELAVVRAGLDDTSGARQALLRLTEGRGAGGVWTFPPAQATSKASALFAEAALDAEAGDALRALEKVRAARELVSSSSRAGRLAMVDEALLAELFLNRKADAAEAWRAVLERFDEAGGEVDFDELLRALEARVRLARLEATAPE